MSQYKVSGNKESGFTLSVDGRVQGVWKQMRDLHNCIMKYHNPEELPRKEVLRMVRVAVKTDGIFSYGAGAKNSNKTQQTQHSQKDAILELVNKHEDELNQLHQYRLNLSNTVKELTNTVKELTTLKEKVKYQAVEIEVLQDDFNEQQQIIKKLVENKKELELEIKNLKKKESVQEIEKVQTLSENKEILEIETIDEEPIELSELIKKEEKGYDPSIENIFSGEPLKKEEDPQKKNVINQNDYKRITNDFDFSSLTQVKIRNTLYLQDMVLGMDHDTDKLVTELGQEVGYFRIWVDEDGLVDEKFKNSDDEVQDPDTNDPIEEFVIEDEQIATIPIGTYREWGTIDRVEKSHLQPTYEIEYL